MEYCSIHFLQQTQHVFIAIQRAHGLTVVQAPAVGPPVTLSDQRLFRMSQRKSVGKAQYCGTRLIRWPDAQLPSQSSECRQTSLTNDIVTNEIDSMQISCYFMLFRMV